MLCGCNPTIHNILLQEWNGFSCVRFHFVGETSPITNEAELGMVKLIYDCLLQNDTEDMADDNAENVLISSLSGIEAPRQDTEHPDGRSSSEDFVCKYSIINVVLNMGLAEFLNWAHAQRAKGKSQVGQIRHGSVHAFGAVQLLGTAQCPGKRRWIVQSWCLRA